MTIRRISLAAGLVLAAVGCANEDLFTNAVPQYQGGAMFQRYVSLGNSLTAGFQSGGINDSTQKQSYAVKLAAAMGGDSFYRPSLTIPGCPPPIDTLFTASGTPHRLGGTPPPPCSLRSVPLPPYISDVAVPGATVFDPIHAGPTPSANALTLLILGARSQIQAARAAQPTFVSAWIGNNDVLGAATDTANAGNPAEVTDTAVFRARYDSLLAGFDSTPSIVGSANCAPRTSGGIGDTVLVAFQYGFGLIGRAAAGVPDTLDCTNDHNIEPAELANIHATVAAYNGVISARATARHWAYVDPNGPLATLRGDTTQVRIFPNTAATSCNETATGSPFGLAFTCDGIHPSNATHHLIAQVLVQAINATYGSAIPVTGVP